VARPEKVALAKSATSEKVALDYFAAWGKTKSLTSGHFLSPRHSTSATLAASSSRIVFNLTFRCAPPVFCDVAGIGPSLNFEQRLRNDPPCQVPRMSFFDLARGARAFLDKASCLVSEGSFVQRKLVPATDSPTSV
jgi:hypothetical protein